MGLHDNIKCTLPVCYFPDTAKHRRNHRDTPDSSKTQRNAIIVFRIIVVCTIERAPICDVASKVAELMVAEPTALATIKHLQSVRVTFVLQMTLFLD